MRLITGLLLLCVLAPLPVGAADLFVKRKEERLQGTPEPTAPLYDYKKEPQKKLDLPPVAEEDKAPDGTPPTAVSKEWANKYYNNCMAAPEQPGMLPESKKALCACTASKMTQAMTEDEIKTMFSETPEGAYQRDRMTLLVYVPCMEAPTRDLIYNHCVGNMLIRRGLKKYHEVCNCLGENMGKYAAENGGRIADEALRNRTNNNLNAKQLLNEFMESPAFQQQSQYYVTTCTQKHEFGW
jgi:hypothetical protein